MSSLAIKCLHSLIPTETHMRIKAIANGALVASAVYLIWGKLAALCCFCAVTLGYVNFDSNVQILGKLNLRGIPLIISILGISFFGGPFSCVGGAMGAVSIIDYEWQSYNVLVGLENANQTLATQNTTLKEQNNALNESLAQLNTTLEQAMGTNEKLRGLWEKISHDNPSSPDQVASLEAMKRFHQFYEQITTDKGVIQDIQAAAQLQRDYEMKREQLSKIEARIELLTKQMETTQKSSAALTNQFAVHVDKFGQNAKQLNVIINHVT